MMAIPLLPARKHVYQGDTTFVAAGTVPTAWMCAQCHWPHMLEVSAEECCGEKKGQPLDMADGNADG